jgi:hypothetical protein
MRSVGSFASHCARVMLCSSGWRRNGLWCGHRVGRPARLRAGSRALGRSAGAAALRARLRGRSRGDGRGRRHDLRLRHGRRDWRRLECGSRDGRVGNRSRLERRRRWSRRRRGGRRWRRRLDLGGGCGRRRGCRRRAGCTPRRKQAEWVHVGLVGTDPHAEMDVRHVVLGIAGRAGSCDRFCFADAVPLRDVKRAEVSERDPVLAGDDRHGEAVRRHLAGERHLARDRSTDRCPRLDPDVDPTMLAGGVLVGHDRELSEHRAIGRPCPGECRRPGSQCPHESAGNAESPSRCPESEHEATVAGARRGGNAD